MSPGEIVTLYALIDFRGNLRTVELYTTGRKAERALTSLSEAERRVYRTWVDRQFVKAEDGRLYQAGLCVSEDNLV
jgi:hypothetical protein